MHASLHDENLVVRCQCGKNVEIEVRRTINEMFSLFSTLTIELVEVSMERIRKSRSKREEHDQETVFFRSFVKINSNDSSSISLNFYLSEDIFLSLFVSLCFSRRSSRDVRHFLRCSNKLSRFVFLCAFFSFQIRSSSKKEKSIKETMFSSLKMCFLVVLVVFLFHENHAAERSDQVEKEKSSMNNENLYQIYKVLRADPRLSEVSNADIIRYIHRTFLQSDKDKSSSSTLNSNQSQQSESESL